MPAQSARRTAHPQDQPHVQTGQFVPLSDHYGSAAGRSQLLIESWQLPGPGAVLLGIEAHGLLGGSVTYAWLRVAVSPVAPNATRSARFDANLPSPTVILQTAGTVTWKTGQWQTFRATRPYVHDGTSSLTIDIQKLAITGYGNGAATGLHRPGTPTMLVAFGGAGSGKNQATTAEWQVIPIDIRLLWSGVPTLHLGSPTTYLHHGFALGSYVDVTVEATPGSPVACLVDVRLGAPVPLPPFLGLLRIQGTRLPMAPILPGGLSTTRLLIPRLPSLVGSYFVFQAATLDAITNRWQLTNAADCVIGK